MKFVDRLIGAIVAAGAASKLARGEPSEDDRERIVAPGTPDPGAELVALVLLILTALGAVLFIVAYGLDWSTQALGGILGGTLMALAAALIVLALRVIATEELSESYPPDGEPEEQEKVAQIIREGATPITRKRLLGAAGALAGTALGAAFVTPAISLGPVFDTSRLNESPWRRGRRLVDEHGTPLKAADIGTGAFYTAFPQGADKKAIAAPVVLVRLAPDQLQLPADRRGWAPQGILAYSKICTHAGCALALYRNPLFEPTEPSHALVCPCHYSTFDVTTGGTVLFGPAGRPLPQLPLLIDRSGGLRAAGDYSGPAGPSWWGVRNRGSRG